MTDGTAASAFAWPSRELLRELHLRSRRIVAARLAAEGLWLDDAAHSESLNRRRRRGEALFENLLVPLLGSDDASLLGAPGVFGSRRVPFRAGLPGLLSFGFEIGRALADEPRRRERAQICALFNFFVAAFDKVCDRLPGGVRALSKVVTPRRLIALSRSPESAERLMRRSGELLNFELRCVGRTLASFFSRVHELAPASGQHPAPLEDALLGAHRAQMLCSTKGEDRPLAEQLEAARAKSTLPFQIMGLVGRLHTEAPSGDGDAAALGTVFGLLDDLVDLSRDLQSGDANSVLLDLDLRDRAAPRASDERALRLLEGSTIEEHAETVAAALRAVLRDRNPRSGVGLVVLSYVRSALTRG